MKRLPTRLPTLTLLGLLAACGGQDSSMEDMDTGAPPAAASQPEAAPSGSALNCYLAGATPAEARARPNPHTTLSFALGSSPALLCYGAPSAQGRQTGMVPNGQPWPLGADEATTLHLSSSANVGGVALQPGSYSLYAIPGPSQWQIFINSNWQRPGAPIDAAVRSTEVGSFNAVPESLPQAVDQLRFEWEAAAGGEPGGELLLEWGTMLLRIPVEA